MSAGGTGGGGGLVRSLGAVAHGDVPGCEVHDSCGNKEGGDFARAAFEQRNVFALDDIESADAGADVNPDALIVLRRNLQGRHFHGFIGGCDRQVNEAAHLFNFFFLDEVQRVEVLDLGGDLAGKLGGVEASDAPDATFAGNDGVPHLTGGVAHATDQADARNYDPASQAYLPPFLRLRR